VSTDFFRSVPISPDPAAPADRRSGAASLRKPPNQVNQFFLKRTDFLAPELPKITSALPGSGVSIETPFSSQQALLEK
jgi:hypothetical protein